MSQLTQVKVPDIGDFDEVQVIELLVNVGDTVKVDQSLITVESDKASMEIPSDTAGVVKSIAVKVGDKVSQGSVILEVEASDVASPAPAKQEAASAAPATKTETVASPAAAVATAPSAAPAVVDVVVPDIGDFDQVDVIEVMVAVGDTIKVDQSLITVESDKASMEIPSSHAGKVLSLSVKVGDKVSKGSVILQVETVGMAEAVVASSPVGSSEVIAVSTPAQTSESSVVTADTSAVEGVRRASPTAAYALSGNEFRNLPHASPSVRRFARELGVDLSQVRGTGRKERITADDVRAFVKAALSVAPNNNVNAGGSTNVGGGLSVLDWPKVDFTKFGPIETKPLSRIKKISGANLHRNWVMIPHVTNNEEADITDLEAFRVTLNKEYEKAGVKFTMLAFLIKAVVQCLKQFPEFNASLDGDNLVMKQYYHIGFAADTPNGLVVPVIRDADKKSISDIAKETSELAKLAREGKLSPTQMQGGCFSISSLGGIGGTHFTPIINAPEVAILGVSRSYQKPVWNGKEFVPRLTIPLSLSYDHRVIDGAAAARFNAYLAKLLADFRRVLV
ncbi:dihydrolipoyllysine-residue acetyltransferase [Pelistega europaea]|uniref:Acetyltransferase component of pyruvate dehydrogenase complex n=1 Tax=Pelistega europaea TaxID=106147 RepID=A0A7Y4P4U7_9BURK|nr:dihydrolipoyllysine-residue acetyltransferase [Pelistega europaea]NOL49063.1 dihydrolipoyllysine-residue acetyltransferase [Pelistega europaea]